MLGAHPEVATTWEAHLFDGYVRAWKDRWERQVARGGEDLRYPLFYGLPAVFTETEFDGLISDVITRVHTQTMSHKPSARVLLEKCPEYSLEVESIVRHVGDARFIHLIRDGREVADSLTNAARTWGASWAPRRIDAAARLWRDHVNAAREAALADRPYLEVRYEALQGDTGPTLISDLFAFCGVDVPSDVCRNIHDQFEIGQIRNGGGLSSSLIQAGEMAKRTDVDTPEGFVGAESRRGWRHAWSAYDRLVFDGVAGDLLRELGYAGHDWPRSSAVGRALYGIRPKSCGQLTRRVRAVRRRAVRLLR